MIDLSISGNKIKDKIPSNNKMQTVAIYGYLSYEKSGATKTQQPKVCCLLSRCSLMTSCSVAEVLAEKPTGYQTMFSLWCLLQTGLDGIVKKF
ncbi:hypothetical protein [Scytonema sp. PRP1]|uniref:hypothetical protein n=1 Tax=Scytonema sp. PRP1 TaxID=3120513 RepID=UPI002FD162C5